MMFRSLLMLSGSMVALQAALAVSLAEELAAGESQALAFDFTDDFWQADTGHYGSAYVLDTGTPANNYDSHPYGLLTYTSPSAKMTLGPDGTLRFGAHNLVLSSGDMTGTGWTATRASVSANVITEDATASESHFAQTTASGLIAGAAYVFRVRAAAIERDWLCIYNSTNTKGQYFNINSGALGSDFISAFDAVDVYASPEGGYWCECTFTATASSATFILYMASGDGGIVYSGNGTSRIAVHAVHCYRDRSDDTYLATTSAARYALPYEWDSDGNLLGILVEEARTNLAQYSEAADNAYWSKDVSTVDANAATAPDGLSTADALIPDSGSVSPNLYRASISVSSGSTYTFSRYLKNGSLGTNWVEMTVVSTSVWRAWFNLSTGAKGTSSGSPTSYTITALPNGWYRCDVTVTTGTTTADVYASPRGSDGSSAAITGDGSSPAFYTWGAQLEAGSFATSYIPTLGSTVTRAADPPTLATTAFATSDTEGTLLAVIGDLPSGAVSGTVLRLAAGGEGYSMSRYTAQSRAYLYDGGYIFGNFQDAPSADKLALAWAQDDAAFYGDGTQIGTDASGTPTAIGSTLYIGWDNATHFNGHIKRLLYVPRRMSNAELQAITT